MVGKPTDANGTQASLDKIEKTVLRLRQQIFMARRRVADGLRHRHPFTTSIRKFLRWPVLQVPPHTIQEQPEFGLTEKRPFSVI
jgi:hypothetical protein